MFHRIPSLLNWVAVVLIFLFSGLSARQQVIGEELIRLLPESTMVYAYISPAQNILQHPLRKTIQDSEPFQQLWNSDDLKELRGGIAFVELLLGAKWERLAQYLSLDGVHLAIDKKTKGVVLLSKTRSARWLKDYLAKIVSLARNDATNKKQPDPVKQATYREVEGFEINKVIFAQIDDTLLVCNRGELAKAVIDRFNDPSISGLNSTDFYRNATADLQLHPSFQEKSIAWVIADVVALRTSGLAKELFSSKPRDFVAELLLGGVLMLGKKTPWAAGILIWEENTVRLCLTSPSEKAWFRDKHEFYVGPEATGSEVSAFPHYGSIATLSTYRNLSELWLRAGDLFDQNTNDQLAQADNTLTTLFSGKDFGTDILGAIEPQIQLLVREQSFENERQPSIRLPSFAFVGTLKQPEGMQRELKRIFQSFIGFLNIVGAMEGRAQLDLDSALTESSKIYWAEYIPDADKKYSNGLPIEFNFSPALAFYEDKIVLASSNHLAKELVLEASRLSPMKVRPTDHTVMTIDTMQVKRLLNDNRDQLISQNMLEKGNSKVAASREIETLLSLLSLIERIDARLVFDPRADLEMEIRFQAGPSDTDGVNP